MEEEYWAKFRATGSVADYLSYRESLKHKQGEGQRIQGESDDGKHNGNGNDTGSGTHRGI